MKRISNSAFLSGLAVSLFLLGAPTSFAWEKSTPEPTDSAVDSDLPAGHSQHGEAFNEGPRQRAYLMGGTGPINFPVTSDVADVRKFVEQGIGQIHGYWYFEAERSFRQAAMLDPNCAIAYWGMALANANNDKRAKEFVTEAVNRKANANRRESLYIDAFDAYLHGGSSKKQRAAKLANAYESIASSFPDDLEAKAFHAYTVYKYRSDLKRIHEDVDRAIQQVLAIEPMHPVHHYRVHNWDTKDAKQALDSASRCGQSAPGIAHMWHMPGHIYSRLKRYGDAAWHQEASARVDHAHMMRDRVLPDQIHNFAHNNEWLVRSLLYVGRWRDALDLARNMVELPRHPHYNTLAKRGSAYYGRLRLFDVLYKFEMWEQLVELANGPQLPPTDRESEQIKRLRFLGVAYAETGKNTLAGEVLADLQQRLAKAGSGSSSRRSRGRSGRSRSTRRSTTRTSIEKAIAAIQGHLDVFNGDYANALTQLRKADEDKLVIARVQCMAGESEQAVVDAADYLKSQQLRVRPMARYVELLWLAGKRDQAAHEFEKLRRISGSIQFGSPIFDRLEVIADELVLPADWRLKSETAEDAGDRPALSSLGPFRWQPSPAMDWVLQDHQGNSLALKHFQAQPVVAIFYLGYGCLHCAEQLKAFAPLAEQYRDAGIEIVAVSTDDREGLQTSLDNYEGDMPFPLLSDSSLEAFKSYRAFDDFEQRPLHGTFLIDGDGNVQWQDVSYEPFMDASFLLKESKRLLAQSRCATTTRFISAAGKTSEQPATAYADRIDPAGINGALILSGSEMPDEAIKQFVGMARPQEANVIVLLADDSEHARDAAQRLSEGWSEEDRDRVRIVGHSELGQSEELDLAKQVTGVWIAGQSESSLRNLVANPSVKQLVKDVTQNGGVVGAAGNAAKYLTQSVVEQGRTSKTADVGLPLLPEAIIDVSSAADDHAAENKLLETHPQLVVYELSANAALVLRGRRMKMVGDRQVRIHLAGGKHRVASTVALSESKPYADLTALRNAARDRSGPEFPAEKPAPPIVEKGTLIIIGGGGMPPGTIARFVELAGGKKASIVVLPTANPDPVPNQNSIVRSFREAGAGSVTVLPGRTLQQVESDEYLDAFRSATGIWFGGGRQWRFADAYLDTKVYDLMHDVLRRGGVVMGSSAGASIQAEYLARANPLGNLDIMAAGYERGMGFLKGTAIDQHFAQRNRFKDMTSLVHRFPQLLGIGIDESTALIVQGKIGTVTGKQSVHFYDRNKPIAEGRPDYESVHDGGRYDLVARQILDPGRKVGDAKQPAAEAGDKFR